MQFYTLAYKTDEVTHSDTREILFLNYNIFFRRTAGVKSRTGTGTQHRVRPYWIIKSVEIEIIMKNVQRSTTPVLANKENKYFKRRYGSWIWNGGYMVLVLLFCDKENVYLILMKVDGFQWRPSAGGWYFAYQINITLSRVDIFYCVLQRERDLFLNIPLFIV